MNQINSTALRSLLAHALVVDTPGRDVPADFPSLRQSHEQAY